MKKFIEQLDATPSKRLFQSIISDYDLNKSICELIDNALDIWTIKKKKKNLLVEIVFDQKQQRIVITDNAGGVKKEDLSKIVSPGQTGNIEAEETIGIFGVGTKRAVIALAQETRIVTRAGEEATYQVEFDDKWLDDNEDWNLNIYQVDNISENTTRIELQKLRNSISSEDSIFLIDHLSKCYGKFISFNNFELLVNKEKVTARSFDEWTFPPSYEPHHYYGQIEIDDGTVVKINVLAGLINESSPSGNYGFYFYCNKRLIAEALKSFDVGFSIGLVGSPHPSISLARVIVSLTGPAKHMPWNSSKSGINPNHEVFKKLRTWLIKIMKDYTSLSRRFSSMDGGWPEEVFKFSSGDIKKIKIPHIEEVNTTYLPPLPISKPRYKDLIKKKNTSIANKRPWAVGLYETLIAVNWIENQDFKQKNRIILILLDSNLEIAFKEYLMNEVSEKYGEERIRKIFSNRSDVHREIKKFINLSNADWKKIEYYYTQRCDLIHRKATGSFPDTEIKDFRNLSQRVLAKLFKINF